MMTLSREGRIDLQNAYREIELAQKKAAAWVIIKGYASQHGAEHGTEHGTEHGVFGKIIVRYTKRASIVSILIYATDSAPAMGASETVTGCGFDRTTLGISTALWRLRGGLFKWHGFRFYCFDCADCPDTPEPGVIRCWNKELKRKGYKVIRVL